MRSSFASPHPETSSDMQRSRRSQGRVHTAVILAPFWDQAGSVPCQSSGGQGKDPAVEVGPDARERFGSARRGRSRRWITGALHTPERYRTISPDRTGDLAQAAVESRYSGTTSTRSGLPSRARLSEGKRPATTSLLVRRSPAAPLSVPSHRMPRWVLGPIHG
jgi:hypothetical protein